MLDPSTLWNSSRLMAWSVPFAPSSPGYSQAIFEPLTPTPRIGIGGHFLGPFPAFGDLRADPTGVNLESVATTVDSDNYGNFLLWDGESQAALFDIPATVSAETDETFNDLGEIAALITFSVSDEPMNEGAGGGALGVGIATEDFQGCALIDAGQGLPIGAYQSITKGWASFVNASSVHAGEVDIIGNIARLRTTNAGANDGSLVGTAFGPPEDEAPGFFRRV
jgi:hypothetical protein